MLDPGKRKSKVTFDMIQWYVGAGALSLSMQEDMKPSKD
jgi:hypothetical protein